MANVVEHVLKITGGKSPETLKKLAKQLQGTLKDLKKIGKQSFKSFNEFRKNSRKASEAIKGLQGAFKKLTIGVGGTAAAFLAMNKVIADSVNEIVDASTRSGIATDTLAGLRLAAEGSGKSFSDLERGLDNFNKKVVDANKDTSASAKEFAALGVSVKNVNGDLKSSNEIFNETIQRLSRVKDATQKNAIAMKLFGRSGSALIQSGAIESMDEFVGRAKELGIALDEDGVQKAADFQRGMADLKTASLGALQSIAEGLTGEKGLGPSLSALAEDLSNFGGGMKIFLDKMKDAFGGMLIFISSVKEGIADLTNDLLTFIGIAPSQIEQKFFQGVKTKNVAAEELEDLGVIETESAIEELIDESRRQGAKNQKVIRKLIKQLSLESDTFKELMEERKVGNEVVDSIFSFLKDESGLNIQEIRDAFNAYVTQNKETRKAIQTSKLEKLTKLIDSGDVKDIESISKQLMSLRKSITETGQSTKDIDKLISSLDKLKNQSRSDIKIDLSKLGKSEGDGDGAGVDNSFVEMQKELQKVTQESLRIIEKQTRAIEKEERAVAKAQGSFRELKKQVELIGETERPLQGILDDLDETKIRFRELGQSAIPVIELKMQVLELRKEMEKLARVKTAINITTDIVGLAGGDIVGGVSGILGKTLSGSALALVDPISALVSSVQSFGSQLMQIGQQAVQIEEERREAKEIERLEEAFGRALTTAEKERVKNDIKIGDKEQRRISEEAMRQNAIQDAKNFVLAIETGLTMLPEILLSVLPRLFIDLASAIVNAIIQLPGRIAMGVINGIKGLFDAIFVSGPQQFADKVGGFFTDLFSFFGVDSKRSGGRMISARRGLRFTGSSDAMAQLHRNEFVVPESGARPQAVERIMNQQSGSGINITINADVVERDAIETLVRKIEQRFQNFGTMQSTLFAG